MTSGVSQAWPTAIRCSLALQGQTINAGDDPDDLSPVALSGLHLTWGRTTTVDQPDTSTAGFTLEVDLTTATDYRTLIELIGLGRRVDIMATGTTWLEADTPTFDDPGFDSTPSPPKGHVTVYGGTAVIDAAGRLRVYPNAATAALSVRIPPSPYAAPDDPSAWDHVPKPSPGQTWREVIGSGWAAPGARLSVGIVDFHTPQGAADGFWIEGQWDPAAGPYDAPYEPTTRRDWQGMFVDCRPTGYTWAEVPGTWAEAPPEWTWRDMAGFALDGVDIIAPADAIESTVLVFSGRVTDSTVQWLPGPDVIQAEVTAADFTAELANRDVGAEPWPLESVASRADRIIAASGADVSLNIDPRPAAVDVTRMDVDRQQAMPMLADLATSTDSALWAATHTQTGPYLWMEDPTARPSVRVLVEAGGIVVIGDNPGSDSLTVSACDVDADVQWLQTNADIATRCVIDWQDQTPTPPDEPTSRSATYVIEGAEDPLGPWGVRRVQVSSLLVDEAEAETMAARIASRLFASSLWRLGSVRVESYPEDPTDKINTVLALLDGTRRIGAGLVITDLPAWTPTGSSSQAGYVEGGTYDFTDGAWTLDLMVSAANGLGQSVRWNELDPAWAWNEFDPAIAWSDLIGVGSSYGGTR